MSLVQIFTPLALGKVTLRNRIVMSPMTRSRATAEGVPTPLMAEYYAQRAAAGLTVTEGTAPSPNGKGYARIPGLWNAEQVAAWKVVTDAVHAKGGVIFAQIMHTGRIGHAANLVQGGQVLAPSAVQAAGQMWTDTQSMQDFPTPRAMTDTEVRVAIAEFVEAAKHAIAAGFDGVELHGANGYLIEQFLNPHSNVRTDVWGGSVEKRITFAVEVAKAVAVVIGGERVGIRLSPHGAASDMKPYDEVEQTYVALLAKLAPLGLAYVHVVDHSSLGSPAVPQSTKDAIRKHWPRTLILAGGFDGASAEAALLAKAGDLIGFARSFIGNPDLVERLQHGAALATPDFATFYTPGAKGYTDYPVAEHAATN